MKNTLTLLNDKGHSANACKSFWHTARYVLVLLLMAIGSLHAQETPPSADSLIDPSAFSRATKVYDSALVTTLNTLSSTPKFFRLRPTTRILKKLNPVPGYTMIDANNLWAGFDHGIQADLAYSYVTIGATASSSVLNNFVVGDYIYKAYATVKLYNPTDTNQVLCTWDSVSLVINSGNPTAVINLDLTPFMKSWQAAGVLTDTTAHPIRMSIQTMGSTTPYRDTYFNLTDGQFTVIGISGIYTGVFPTYPCFTTIGVTGTNPLTFTWNDCAYAEDYQIQVLRLYNTDPAKTTDANITANVDWSQALTLETNTGDHSITLTMAEGTGYYLWRVRRIMNRMPNGVGDDQNWDVWSDAGSYNNNGTYSISNSNLASYLFFYNQFDDSLNWIYHRQFVEGEVDHGSQIRVGEKINYADYLLMPAQEQVKNQTANNVIAAQTIPDFSGRPAMKTLPAPVNKTGLAYEYNFVKNSAGNAFTAADYDQQSNYASLSSSAINSSSKLIQYYSDANTDLNVPTAGGYPYSRTRYYNDGMNRERELATPGAVHALGQHTVRKYYSKPTAAELIKVLGDEAPDAESVLKTTTVDPNGVYSVVYTDQDNRTLITCNTTPQSTLLNTITSNGFTTYDTVSKKTVGTPGTRLISTATYTFAEPTQLNYLYNLYPKIYNDNCILFCGTCDYKVKLTAHNRDDTAQDAAHVYYDSMIVGPYISNGMGWCDPATATLPGNGGSHIYSFGTGSTATALQGTYDISLSIELATSDPVSHQAYIDSSVNVLRGMVSGMLSNNAYVYPGGRLVNIGTIQSYIDNNDIPGLVAYTHMDTTVPYFYIVIAGCGDTLRLPTAHCTLASCGSPHFAEYMVQKLKQYDSTLPSPFFSVTDISSTADGSSIFTVASNAAFNAIISRMVNEYQYDCDSLWNAWVSTVQGFIISQKATADQAGLNFSSAPKVDWWGSFMAKAGYKRLQWDYGSYYAAYPFLYFPYTWGTYPAIESAFCTLNGGSCPDASGPPPAWYSSMPGFPTDPSTTPGHIYNFFQAIKGASIAAASSGSSLLGMASTSGVINNGLTPAQARQEAVENCIKRCDGRLDGLINQLSNTALTTGYKVDGMTSSPLIATFLPVMPAGDAYCIAYSAIKRCEEGCQLKPDPSGHVDTVQDRLFKQSLMYDLEVQLNPPGVIGCDSIQGWRFTEGCGAPSAGGVSVSNADAMLQGLNKNTKLTMEKLKATGYTQLTTFDAFGNNTLINAFNPCGSARTMLIRLTDYENYFFYSAIKKDSVVGAGFNVIRYYPDSIHAGSTQEVRLVVRFTSPLSAGDSIVLDEVPPTNAALLSPWPAHYVVAGPRLANDTMLFIYHYRPTAASGGPIPIGYGTTVTAYSGGSSVGGYALMDNGLNGTIQTDCITLKYYRKNEAFIVTITPICLMNPCSLPLSSTLVHGCIRWVPPYSVSDTAVHADTVQALTCEQLICRNLKVALKQQRENILAKHEGLLRQSYKTNCLTPDSVKDRFVNYFTISQYNYTLYYYDRAGNLVRTVAPAGVQETGTSRTSATQPNHNYATRYTYNTLGLKLTESTPDGNTSTFVYDDNGRLRFSQNGEQYYGYYNTYNKYDALSRVVETGQYADALPQTHANDQTYPSSGITYLTKTVYGTPYSGSYAPSSLPGQGPFTQFFLDNRISYTITDEDGNLGTTSDQAQSIYSYDAHGNVGLVAQWVSPMPRAMPVQYSYDLLSNKPTSVLYGNVNYRYESYAQLYSYDGDKRLTKVQSTMDGSYKHPEALYSYYLHGPLKRTELGYHVQGLDYTYTIEGWLKGINHPSLAYTDPGADGYYPNMVGGDMFGLSLNYYENDFARSGSPFNNGNRLHNGSLYNGNIVSQESSTSYGGDNGMPLVLGSQYNYDQLNRLKASTAKVYSNGSSTWGTDYYNETFSYDGNGNFTNVTRQGGSTSALMDNLTYTLGTNPIDVNHRNNNQVISITDAATGASKGTMDYPSGTHGYAFDHAGRMTSDGGQGTTMTWRPDGRLHTLTKGSTTYTYLYDAMGNRVSMYNNSGVGTVYLRDATGNPLTTYTRNGGSFTLAERYIYGSERLATIYGANSTVTVPGNTIMQPLRAVYQVTEVPTCYCIFAVAPTSLSTTLLPNIGLTIIPHLVSPTIAVPSVYTTGLYTPQSGTMVSLSLFQTTYMQAFDVNQRWYELHDHLGNVRMITSDQVWYNGMYNNVNPGGFYTYYAFGSLMPSPYWDRVSDGGYKFGFNSQERDDYISGSGNSMAFKFREQDTRIGRFMSVDPLKNKYPYWSPYVFVGNNPILYNDPDGRELHIGGNKAASLADIQSLVPSQYAPQIKMVDDKIVFEKFNDLPSEIKTYKGVNLVDKLVNSSNKYQYSVANEAIATSRDTKTQYNINLKVEKTGRVPNAQNAVLNLSKTIRTDISQDWPNAFSPQIGFDGSLTMREGEFSRGNSLIGPEAQVPIKRNTIVFHELQENYERTENGKDYSDAHKAASKEGSQFSKEVNGKRDINAGTAEGFVPSSK